MLRKQMSLKLVGIGKSVVLNVLLDDGATNCFISRSLIPIQILSELQNLIQAKKHDDLVVEQANRVRNVIDSNN